MVKFFKDYPYLSRCSMKDLNGDIIYMNDGEIWYRDKDVATLVLLKRETGFSYDKFG